MKRFCFAVGLLTAACLLTGIVFPARGIILLSTGDPMANTTAPTGGLTDGGWQYEGQWGGFLGTPIAPHFFLSAAHIGQAGSVFTFQGVNYTPVKAYRDPNSDLLIWEVAETFPTYAPMYAKSDETGKRLVAIGRGTQRGAEIRTGGILRGWQWGGGDGVQRWGQNTVSEIVSFGTGNDGIAAAFNANGGADECTFSVGDSGGAVFINDGGTWKLAGINYGVDGPFYTDAQGGGGFNAALIDARAFYYYDGAQFQLIGGASAAPTSLYATQVSSKLAWIYSVIDPNGDPDGDGIPNLTEYALRLDPLAPNPPSALPQTAVNGNAMTLTYTKAPLASDLVYAVEQSTDLISWSAAQTQDQVTARTDNTQTVVSTVQTNGAPRFFLRLRVTRP